MKPIDIIFILLTLAALGGIIYLSYVTWRNEHLASTNATVKDSYWNSSRRFRGYRTTAEFSVDGRVYTVVDRIPTKFEPGQTIAVYYDPRDPSYAKLELSKERIFTISTLAVLSLFVVGTIVVLVKKPRRGT